LLDDAPALDFDVACALALTDIEKKAMGGDPKRGPFHESQFVQRPKVTVKKFSEIGDDEILFS
jgi:hypothetical protein